MGVTLSFSEEVVSPVSAARLFRAMVLDATNFFPKLYPDLLLSAAIVEGDGGSGTIKEYHFSPSAGIYSYARERHFVIDQEKLEDKWTWIEGGDMEKLISYAAWTKFEPTTNRGCLYKVGAEYKPVDGVDFTEEMKVDKYLLTNLFKVVKEHLLGNPDAYA